MISFGAPAALLSLLALLPAGGALFFHHWRDAQSDVALGGGEPLRRGRSTRRVRIRHALLLGTLTLAALAAARPQWGTSGQPVTRRGIDIAIALDVSRSMTATDVTPTRAEAAARAADDAAGAAAAAMKAAAAAAAVTARPLQETSDAAAMALPQEAHATANSSPIYHDVFAKPSLMNIASESLMNHQ